MQLMLDTKSFIMNFIERKPWKQHSNCLCMTILPYLERRISRLLQMCPDLLLRLNLTCTVNEH
ncbi:hypothetical protein D3C75_1242720 [compost metagenome]